MWGRSEQVDTGQRWAKFLMALTMTTFQMHTRTNIIRCKRMICLNRSLPFAVFWSLEEIIPFLKWKDFISYKLLCFWFLIQVKVDISVCDDEVWVKVVMNTIWIVDWLLCKPWKRFGILHFTFTPSKNHF